MPNLVRRSCPLRSLRSPGQSTNLARNPGTRLTYRERCRIFALFYISKWSQATIAMTLGLPRTTVHSVIYSMVETPTKQMGRQPMLISQIRKRLVAHATLNAGHRRMTYQQIAHLERVMAGRKALGVVFKKELYRRRVATTKPLLTNLHKKA